MDVVARKRFLVLSSFLCEGIKGFQFVKFLITKTKEYIVAEAA